MSTADTINSIRTHLTADYESLENIGAELENVDKNIENIASVVNGIYDNLPKTTGEGSSLSLNTLKGKMNTQINGDTEQTQYQGYNELNIYAVHPKGYSEVVSGVTIKYNENGSVTATGTATADVSYFLGSRASLGDMFNGTYYLSGCTNGSLTTYFLQMWAETLGTYQQTTTEVSTNKVSGKNWNVTIQVKSGASVNYTFYPMMSKTSGKSFEPYVGGTASPNPSYPQNIEVVTGTQEVKVENVNYFTLGTGTYSKAGITGTYNNSKLIVNGTTSQSTNIIEPNVKSIGIYKAGNYVLSTKILGGTITLNGGACAIIIRNSSTQSADTILTNGNYNIELTNKTFSLSEDTELFAQIYCNASNVVFSNYEVGIQIEKGSTATTYTPHQEQTQIVSLGDIELCKIGNYQDYLEYDVENDKVYKNKSIRKVVFNGSETGWERNTTTLGYRYRINQADIKPNADNSTIASMYSNYLRATSPDRLYNDDNYSISCFSGTAHTIIIACISNETDTLEKWKTWLSTHNVEVYYVLAEAVKEEITGTLKDQIKALYNAMSYNGTTNISSSGSLPMILNVSALKGE